MKKGFWRDKILKFKFLRIENGENDRIFSKIFRIFVNYKFCTEISKENIFLFCAIKHFD